MIWDSITFVVAFDSLYNNFEIIIISLFYLSNKNLEKIQLVVISPKAKNLAKQAIGIIRDLIIMMRKKKPQ